ncbi:superoxide dismutase family protein [Modestobacter lapidis]|nr:hypothetical protein [Modestobacter lapidis]
MRSAAVVPATAALLLLAACGDNPTGVGGSFATQEGDVEEPIEVPVEVSTELVDPEGSVLGTATFTDTDSGVEVEVDASGLSPGTHPVGLYEVGICEPDSAAPGDPQLLGDFLSAGELIVFTEDPGDLPPLIVGEAEVARMSSMVGASDLGDLLDEDGSALIVHAATDAAAPSAEAAGSRLACAEISG